MVKTNLWPAGELKFIHIDQARINSQIKNAYLVNGEELRWMKIDNTTISAQYSIAN
jgi:hypothetical protein